MITLGYDDNLILDTYVSPLRSALMIDDKFPTFEDMLEYQKLRDADNNALPPSYDYDSLSVLLTECRGRHLLCDVIRRVDDLAKVPLEHLGKSDLVVLDYHLENSNPEKAIAILQQLAGSPHANLVVVYTLEKPLDRVRRTVACRFRGATQMQPRTTLSVEQEEFLQMWQPNLSSSDIDAYLRGDRSSLLGPASNLAKDLIAQNIPRKAFQFLIPEVIEEYLRKNYLPPNAIPSATPNPIQLNGPGNKHEWLSFGNVFVVFVAKNHGLSIFAELEAALVEWQPLPMKMMLAYIRNQFEKGGFQFEAEILADSQRLTGWFYHALTGEDPELHQRLKQLWARLLDGLRGQLAETVTEFGAKILGPSITNLGAKGNNLDKAWPQKCLRLAKQLAGGAGCSDDSRILHALNAFLCSEEYDGSHIRTGTVCKLIADRSDEGTKEQWLLCASPACEMVPRPPKGKGAWTHDLDPLMAVTVLRLEPEKNFQTPLADASNGKHIFLIVDGEPMSFEVVDAKTGHPNSEVIFVADRGMTNTKSIIEAYFIRRRTISEAGTASTATTPTGTRPSSAAIIASSPIAESSPPKGAGDSIDLKRVSTNISSVEQNIATSSVIAAEPAKKGEISEPALDAATGVSEESHQPLIITSVKMIAIAQLRPSYADRFLHQQGHNSSRIGVDFVNSF
jgi:hypothetical protein